MAQVPIRGSIHDMDIIAHSQHKAGYYHPSCTQANIPKFSTPRLSVSPLPFIQKQKNLPPPVEYLAPPNPACVPTIYTTTVPAPKTCLGIAYGNSGSILRSGLSALSVARVAH